jgi:rare lipoprotein A
MTVRAGRGLAIVWIATSLAACSMARTPDTTTPSYSASARPSVIGIASWYGPGFDGHRTSSGAIYDENDLTAASVLFPLGTRLRVTNLSNGRTVEVSVNDHGPYVKGRGLDLSHRAAKLLGIVGPGTASVRMEVLNSPVGGPAIGQRYFVQIGSFSQFANAAALRNHVAMDCPDARVVEAKAAEGRRYRVRMGAYLERRAAENRAALLTRLGYRPMIISE